MRAPSALSRLSILAILAASACGSGGDHPSGSASSGAGSGGGASASAGSSGSGGSSGGAGGASGSTSSSGSAASSGGTGGASSSGSGSSGSTSSSGSGGDVGAPCAWPQGCAPGLYCNAPGCGAGTCAPKPGVAMVPNTEDLVCGCDKVTYWNPETAAYHGASVLAKGACPGAMSVPCSAAMPCAQGQFCNLKVMAQAQCAVPGQGACWSMPVSCPVSGAKGKACSNAACASQCLLIQSQNPWWDDGLCP